jgi:hypothetical protein
LEIHGATEKQAWEARRSRTPPKYKDPGHHRRSDLGFYRKREAEGLSLHPSRKFPTLYFAPLLLSSGTKTLVFWDTSSSPTFARVPTARVMFYPWIGARGTLGLGIAIQVSEPWTMIPISLIIILVLIPITFYPLYWWLLIWFHLIPNYLGQKGAVAVCALFESFILHM